MAGEPLRIPDRSDDELRLIGREVEALVEELLG